jgi:hypothetical protein
LEQRLTPEGVQLVLDRVRSLGWFDRDRWFAVERQSFFWGYVSVWNGDRLVNVRYAGSAPPPELAAAPTWSPQVDAAARLLQSWVVDPLAWLPGKSWAKRDISAYIPTEYAICLLEQVDVDHWAGMSLDALPESAKTLLYDRGSYTDPVSADEQECRRLGTEDVRALIEILEGAGYNRAWTDQSFFTFESPVAEPRVFEVEVDPILPDGEVQCRCG